MKETFTRYRLFVIKKIDKLLLLLFVLLFTFSLLLYFEI